MRWKIIVVNGGIVALVGLLLFAVLRTTLADQLTDPTKAKRNAERAAHAATTQLAMDALHTERWLLDAAAEDSVRSVYQIGNVKARAEAATTQSNRLVDAAGKDPTFGGMLPTLVLFVDAQGVTLGRNNATLMRGEPLASVYPSLKDSIQSRQPSSAVWQNPERQEQLLASYAPVTNESDQVVGALVVGTPLNDERLERTSDLTSGSGLLFAVEQDDSVVVAANTSNFPKSVLSGDPLMNVLKGAQQGALERGEITFGSAQLQGHAGSSGTLLSSVPSSNWTNLGGLLWPIWGVTALGLAMVVAAGFMLGAYVSRPISQLEEGLLTIINGKTDMRFELQHAELGGLVSRINSLLNSLTGVSESDGDSDG